MRFWQFPGMSASAYLKVASDAVCSLGFGAFFRGLWFYGLWARSHQLPTIGINCLQGALSSGYCCPPVGFTLVQAVHVFSLRQSGICNHSVV